MDTDKKRMLVFGILIGLAIIGSIVYFFWSNVINRGTIKIIAEAPFSVEVFGSRRHECPDSPCAIKLKSGYKDLIISKDGARTIVIEAKVKLWGTTELNLSFDILPNIIETESIPEEEIIPIYDLVFDNSVKAQKLIRLGDISKTAIVYFSRAFEEYLIIGGKKSVLIIDKEDVKGGGYLVNIKNNSREKIENNNLKGISAGSWSASGKYLIFKKTGSLYLWLLNTENYNIERLPLATELRHTSWIYNDNLIFVTNQDYDEKNDTSITLFDQKALAGFTFGIYHPDEKIFKKIGSFPQVNRLPEKFISTANGSAIYFRLDGKNFKISLQNRDFEQALK